MSRYQPDYKGLGELLRSEQMKAGLHVIAERIKDAAVAESPVGPLSDPHRGEYLASWEVETGVQHHETSRAYARVKNSAGHAAEVEFGNSHQQGRHVLTRALDAARE